MAYSSTKMKRKLGSTAAEQLVRGLLLLIIWLLPIGTMLILSEHQAVIAGHYNSFAVPRVYAVEGLISLTAIVWVTVRRPAPLQLWPYRWLLIVWLVAVSSFVWAPIPGLAVVSALHLGLALLLMMMLAGEFRDEKFFYLAGWTFIAAVAVQAGWASAQWLLQHDLGLQRLGESQISPETPNVAKVAWAGGSKMVRVYGSLPHPNVLAAYFSVAVLFLGSVVFWPTKQAWRRVVTAGLLALIGVGLVLTFSRVALLATLVGGSLLALFSYRLWRRFPVGLGLAAAVVLVMALLVWPLLASRGTVESPEETGVTNRLVGYEVALDVINSRPVGVGAGSFVPAIGEVRSNLPGYQHQPVHNAGLLAAAELGAVTGLLLMAWLANLGWRLYRVRPRRHRGRAARLALLVTGGTMVVMSLADHFFWSLPQGLWLAALLAAAALSRLPGPSPGSPGLLGKGSPR